MSRIKFLNTHVDNLTMQESIQAIDNLLKRKKQSYVVTPNLDHIVMLEKDAYFKEVYDNASLVLTDGQPLMWISKMKKKPIVEKVSGADLFPKVCQMAAEKGYSMYILGAAEGVADRAADKLSTRYVGLNVVGTFSPEYGFEKNEREIDRIIDDINMKQPDILAVSLGTPKAEKFIYKYRHRLDVGISMSIGAAVDFEAGNVKRAPQWMSKAGLEWLYRIMKEPKRLLKRYWRDAYSIVPIILKY